MEDRPGIHRMQDKHSSSHSEQLAATCQSAVSVASESAGLIKDTRLNRVYAKNSRVLVPIFLSCIIWNHIDRTNLAFAALTMNRDLGFNAAVYGLGSALFFPTFCLFQVPSNLIMLRVGVRWWLGFLLLGWGVVASCFALIHDKTSFFVMRMLLGVFESGAAPAMWFHLSQFFPQERIIKPYSYMSMGILLANVLGAPLAAGFLAMDGIRGLAGWQWLFLLEGVPSVLLGLLVMACVPERPEAAAWLSDSEKALLMQDMAKAAEASPPRELISRRPCRLLGMALANPLISYMCVVGFLLSVAAYTFIFFLPMIVGALLGGHSLAMVPAAKAGQASLLPVLLTSIPYTVGAITTWVVAHSSQKRQELYWHCGLSLLFAGVFFALFPVMSMASVAVGFVALVLTVAGGAAANGPGITIVANISKGPSQVVGMPLYNSISVVGGFVGPYMAGTIVQQTGNFKLIAVIMGVLLCVDGLLVLLLKPLAAARSRRLARSTGATRGDLEHSQAGSSSSSDIGTCSALPPRAPHAADGSDMDESASRSPSACVIVGLHKDVGVSGGQVRCAGAAAGLAGGGVAAGSGGDLAAHRRVAAQPPAGL